jgi:hypothetical protein
LAPLHVAVASLGPACACRVAGRVRMPGVCRTHACSLAHWCEWCRSTHGWRAELEAHQKVRVGPHAQRSKDTHARTSARVHVRRDARAGRSTRRRSCSRLHRRRQGRAARLLAHHLPRPASASSFQIRRHAHLPRAPPAPVPVHTPLPRLPWRAHARAHAHTSVNVRAGNASIEMRSARHTLLPSLTHACTRLHAQASTCAPNCTTERIRDPTRSETPTISTHRIARDALPAHRLATQPPPTLLAFTAVGRVGQACADAGRSILAQMWTGRGAVVANGGERR